MRKSLLLIAMALFSLTAAQAQLTKDAKLDQKWTLEEADPTNMNPVNPQTALDNFARKLVAKNNPMRRTGFAKAPKREAAQPVKYLVAAQSFTKDYTFVFEGGDYSVWDINVTVDGTDVTFEHLFHIEALSPEWNPYVDEVITGVYDAEAQTVSIAAPPGASGTVAATGNGSFITVISGEVNENAQMIPENYLVFDVQTDADGKITRMTSRYPIALPTYYGQYTYGNNAVYRQFIINLPGDDASLLATSTSLELGECFLNEEISGQVKVINLGGATASFVVDVECEPEGYIISGTPTGEIESGEIKDIVFTLKGIDVNDDVEGIATISYEGGDAEGSFDVVLHGKVVPAPDFSPIVTNGDFTFKTNIDAPWEVMTDEEGVQWAKSGAKGRKLTSDLYVNFVVPEGQIGTLSWVGQYKNNPAFRYSFYNLAGWYIDSDNAEVVMQYEGEANGEKEFGPGAHFIRFQQQAQYASGYEDDGLYIRNLNLDLVQPDDDVAEVKTPEVKFGYFILEEGNGVDGAQTIIIQNRGVNKLSLLSITCDNNEFAAGNDVEDANTLENLVIPVYFSSTVAGKKNATFTVETTAGTFTIAATANVISQPDFSQIVTEGAEYITFTTNPTSPFVVEDGVAYNVDCDDEDLTVSSQSSMDTGTDLTLNFDIPQGKIGYITWEGKIWGDLEDNTTYSHLNGDFGLIFINQQPIDGYGNMAQKQVFCTDLENGGDASSRQFSESSGWEQFLTYVPGSHSITFRYYHNGDGITYGKNRFEISNVCLHIEDFQDNGAQLMTEGPIEFEPTYVGYGRYSSVNVTLLNTGSKPLSVTGFEAQKEDSPFLSILPNYSAQFNNTLSVQLVFYPGVHLNANGTVAYVDESVGLEDTWYYDQVTIKTTGGDFTLDVSGMSLGSEGIVFIGDFEDNAMGWERIDHDGDGRNWDVGTQLWYYENPAYCHSGVQCIGSASDTGYGALTPDNWVYSPEFTVPDDGAILTWWVASLHNTKCAEHYSVYIEEDFSDESKLDDLTPVFSETLDEIIPTFGYNERIIDLKDYAGKTVRMAFRHHDCTAQYLLLIDDAFVFTNEKWDVTTSINGHQLDKSEIVSREYFNAAGQRVESPVNGLNIMRQTMKDGSVKSVKWILK